MVAPTIAGMANPDPEDRRPLIARRMTSDRVRALPGRYDDDLQVHVDGSGRPLIARYMSKQEKTFAEKDPPGPIPLASLGTETRAGQDVGDPIDPMLASLGTATKADKDPGDPADPLSYDATPDSHDWGDSVITGRVAI